MEGTISEIRLFAGNFAPRNWAFCQGQILAIASNTALFSLLGTTYGGNGQTTFALPDLRSRIAVGTGQGPGLSNYILGQVGGTENNTLLMNNLPPHTHTAQATATLNCNTGNGDQAFPTNNFSAGSQAAGRGNVDTPYAATADGTMAATAVGVNVQVGVAGGGMPVNNLQPYMGMNYIICLYGIFPSRG